MQRYASLCIAASNPARSRNVVKHRKAATSSQRGAHLSSRCSARSWDTKSLTTLALWCGLLPYAIYRITVSEFNKVDDAAGRPQRAMWGNDR